MHNHTNCLHVARRVSRGAGNGAISISCPSGDQTPKTVPDRQRNTLRGLRAKEAIHRRNKARSVKRRLARQANRLNKTIALNTHPRFAGTKAAQAQEPAEAVSASIKYGVRLQVASCNIRGLNKLTKRQQLQSFLSSHNIDIILLQETKVKHKGTEQWGPYTAFFSSQSPTIITHTNKNRNTPPIVRPGLPAYSTF